MDNYYCIVQNDKGVDTSNIASIKVVESSYPVADIRLNTETYWAGDTIYFEGEVSDMEDGDISAENLTWWINFHHDEHFHPAMDPTTGLQQGAYPIVRFGETDTNVFYRIHLSVTDSDGLTTEIDKDVNPAIVDMQFTSEPEGIDINIDGGRHIATFRNPFPN